MNELKCFYISYKLENQKNLEFYRAGNFPGFNDEDAKKRLKLKYTITEIKECKEQGNWSSFINDLKLTYQGD